jgi:hypothetical protein
MTGRRKGVWIILLLAIIGLTAATIYTTQQRALAADKARFVQAEKDVDDISARIIAATGQPLKVDKRKYCSRPNLKFEEGQLSCDIEIIHFYAVADHTQASGLRGIIEKISPINTSTQSDANKKQFTRDVIEYSANNLNYQKFILSFNTTKNFPCKQVEALFRSQYPPYPEYDIQTDSPYIFASRTSCSKSSSDTYYPMR